MPGSDWDLFIKSYPSSAHLIAGLVPRTANAARLGRPGRLNRTYATLMGTLVGCLRPRGQYAMNHVHDAMGSMVLVAFEQEEDSDRLAEVTGAFKSDRFLGTWASCRTFLYDRHARRQLVDFARGQAGEGEIEDEGSTGPAC
jgi:hypothetical protein